MTKFLIIEELFYLSIGYNFFDAYWKCNKKSFVNFDILGVGDRKFEGVVGGSRNWEQPDSEVDCWDRVYSEALKHTNAGGTMEL